MTALILAGINDSGPGHWQRLWAPRFSRSVWVEHAEWDRPGAGEWVRELDAAAAAAPGPQLVVAHSLGCLLLAQWLSGRRGPGPAGAFLVAPPDPASPAFPHHLASGFRPGNESALGIPALVVASRDDPYGGFGYASRCAAAWGAPIIDAGAHGHLNAASGLGDWPEGWGALQAFLKRLGLEQP